MKTIADAAMAAIEAGEAIVTGAVEITPRLLVDYTTVGIFDLDATTQSSKTTAGGLLVGTEIGPFDPTDIIRVSLPPGQTFTAWNDHGTDPDEWRNFFNAIPDGVPGDTFQVGPSTFYTSQADAFAGFGVHTFTGASTYTLFFWDAPNTTPNDNTGGLSIHVQQGVIVNGSGTPIRLWGGYGTLSIGGNPFAGIGARGLAQRNGGAIGGIAQGMTLTLSGIEPAALALLDADEIKQAAVVLYRLIFAGDGKTLLDAHVFDRGRVDTVETDETIGKEAAINVAVESTARGLGRLGARMRADSDQRLIDADDGYFKNTAYAGQKTLYWGGKKPARSGSALSGGSTGGTTISVGSPTGDRA